MNEHIRKQFKCLAEVLEREVVDEELNHFNAMMNRDDWVNLNVVAIGQLENGDVHYFGLTRDENTGHQMVFNGLECRQPEDSSGLYDAFMEMIPQGTVSSMMNNEDKSEFRTTGYVVSETHEVSIESSWTKRV